MTYRYRGLAILLGTIFVSLPVLAQGPDEVARRRTLLDEARKTSSARDHVHALSLAVQAARIRMTPSLRLFIAQQQSLLGQLTNAMASSELCAQEAAEDIALKNRRVILDTCKDLIAELERSAARITVLWTNPVPPEAQVLIGGQVVPESIYGRTYLVSPGYVRVDARAPGYVRFSRELELEPQQEMTVTISLAEEPATAQASKHPVNADAPLLVAQTSQSLPSRDVAALTSKKQSTGYIGPYLVLGAGAASLTTSMVFLILRNNALNNLDAQCGGPNHSVCTDTPEARSLRRKASTYNVLTDVALGVGGAAVVGGGIWLFSEKARSTRTRAQAELQITPTPGGAVVGIAGVL